MISFLLPVRTWSALNERVHWAVKAKRAKAERKIAALCTPKSLVELPCTVRLTRVSAGELDDDNLRGALKGVRDGIASKLGVDDRDPRVSWAYAQEKGLRKRFAVRVDISQPFDTEPGCTHNCDDPTCRAHWRRP